MRKRKLKAKSTKAESAEVEENVGATGTVKLKAKRRLQKGSIQSASASNHSPEDLLTRAEELLNVAEVEAAQLFCLRALECDPTNLHALELCGLLMLESGDQRKEEARFCFERVSQMTPKPHHSVLLYLAQLSEGETAVGYTERALQLMREALEVEAEEMGAAATAALTPQEARHKPATWRDVSNAHCALAELFMTDLCDAAQAEQRCAAAVDAALASDGTNPDAHHLRASLHIVKGELEPARDAMKSALQLWLPALRDAVDKGQQEKEEEEETEAEAVHGGDLCDATGFCFEGLLKATETLVELDMLTEAAEVLEFLNTEDDEDLRGLYLTCLVHFKLWERCKKGEGDGEMEVEEAAANARTFIQSGLELFKSFEEEELENHLREMMEALGSEGIEPEEEEVEIPESSEEEEEDGEGEGEQKN